MAKNDPRSQIPPPVLAPPNNIREQIAVMASQAVAPASALAVAMTRPHAQFVGDDPPSRDAPAITELAARAITNGAAMAREYAAAAGELCRTADTHPQGRANARRLLRLALAHLET